MKPAWLLTVAVGFGLGGPAVCAAQDKAPPPRSPAENLCRSTCGQVWVQAQNCGEGAAACQRRADQSYRQCLPGCAAGKDPRTTSFAWLKSARLAPAPVMAAAVAPRLVLAEPTATAPWTNITTPWRVQPSQASATLPHAFNLPPALYSYGGVSETIDPVVTRSAGLLRVDVVVTHGRAGLILAGPGGGAQLSREAELAPSPQVQSVYFKVGPQTPPAVVVVRNHDQGGAPGGVTVQSLSFSREAVLPAGETVRVRALD